MLFESLASSKGESSIGIILSGTGSDGARGIRAIKGEGGFGIVQEPSSAKYDGMPNAAINSGNVDLILPANEIGGELKNIAYFPKKPLMQFESELTPENYTAILDVLKKRYEVDFKQYKKTTVTRRIERRMTALKITRVVDYLEYLKGSTTEAEVLFNDMLIGVTSFFRDGSAFNRLSEELSHYIRNNKSKSLRVWVPGCSTGEEAYSLAILIAEILGNKLEDYKVQIFATDIDRNSIAYARNGIYPEAALNNLPDVIRRKYFTVNGESFQVIKPIKALVIFSVQNVTVDPPFLRLDLISCRNMLIYFNIELQRKVLPVFHYALNAKGLLFLGQSESIGMFQEQFRSISGSAKIYEANFLGQKTVPTLHSARSSSMDVIDYTDNQKDVFALGGTAKRGSDVKSAVDSLTDLITRKLKEIVLPYAILINENMDIVFTYGKNPVIERSEGLPSNNVYKNIHSNLTIDLRSGIHQLQKGEAIVRTGFQKLETGGSEFWARMILSQGNFIPGMGELIMVFFQIEEIIDLPVINSLDEKGSGSLVISHEQERQLMKAKEQLQTVI